MRKFVPLLATALAGAIPSTDDATSPTRLSRNRDSESGATVAVWPGSRGTQADLVIRMSLVRTKAHLGHLARDAESHWRDIGESSLSLRGRWEARRRELLCRAWIADRRTAVRRLVRAKNPHPLSYLEICLEFGNLSEQQGWSGPSVSPAELRNS
jgi:hypothetical protein